MSSLSARLLGVRRLRRSPWTARWAEVTHRLVADHGTPTLGNFRDPVKEIFYILLSAKTADVQYRATHKALHLAYPTLQALAAGRVSRVQRCIASGGLGAIRAPQIIAAARLLLKHGRLYPARFLRSLDPQSAFAFLTSLPGIGPKSAFCIMMYSLEMDVFPVDVNVIRIAERLGAIPKGSNHVDSQKALARQVPDGECKALHIGLVVHGRKVCVPGVPRCEACSLADLCPTGGKKLRNNSLVQLNVTG